MIGNQDAAKRVRVDSYELWEGDGSLDEVTGNFGKVGGVGGTINGDSGGGARMEENKFTPHFTYVHYFYYLFSAFT